MIFVTVGTQLAFPRLIAAMETYATLSQEQVVAQVGPDRIAALNLERHVHLRPAHYVQLMTDARAVVAHAGIGTILSAQTYRRPLVVLPRRHARGEHRNDHQMATAAALEGRPGLRIAWEAHEIAPILAEKLEPMAPGVGGDTAKLIDRLRRYIAA